jgi:hypothetical protein
MLSIIPIRQNFDAMSNYRLRHAAGILDSKYLVISVVATEDFAVIFDRARIFEQLHIA